MTEEVIQVPAGLTTTGLLGRRYLARFIDTFVIGLLVGGVLFAEGALIGGVLHGAPGLLLNIAGVIVVVAVWISYGASFESSPWQATLGKRIMGLRVYDASGARMMFSQAAIRNLTKDGPFIILGFVPGGQLFGLLWLAVQIFVMHRSPVYQAIHDRVVHSWVAAPEETIQLRIA